MRKGNFAGELETISTNVEEDVSRVITLLRDETAREADDAQTATSKFAYSTPAPRQIRRLRKGDIETTTVRQLRTMNRHTIAEAAQDQAILENVTMRLTRGTNQLLTEAALRQKLAKPRPNTRQDVIEEAVRQWLDYNSYGGGK